MVEHEFSRPCFLSPCTDELPDNMLIVKGRRWPLISDHCGGFIDAMPRISPCMLTPLCLSSFVSQPCSQEPSLGVPNGMLAELTVVSVPCVCLCDCMHMDE